MNEEMRRVFNAKRKRQKKRRKERKKEEARQARAADRERRIQQQAERIVQTRVQKGELKVVDKEGNVSRAAAEKLGESTRKRANPSRAIVEEEGPSKKVVRRQTQAHVVLKEICPDQLAMKNVPLGSGSFGSCYLAAYRGIDVVVKEFRLRYYNNGSKKEAETRVREELIYEARIMTKLGDHPGLPLLFGVCSERAPYRIIMQFHGSQDGSSMTIANVLAKKQITDKATWTRVICKTAVALSRIHGKGFLHNDLKSDNVVIDHRNGTYNPVVIDFGKSVPLSGARGPKILSLDKQRTYSREFPHIAPEIVGGFRGQSVASDIFSLAKIAETIFRKAELGHLPVLFVQALNADPTKRPSLDKIIAIM